MTEEEAIILWSKIKKFTKEVGREPSMSSFDPQERRMAEALILLRKLKRERGAKV